MMIRDYPIDRELSYEAGHGCTALKFLPYNEPIFEEHFPERSVYPGSMIMNSVLAAADAYLSRAKTGVLEAESCCAVPAWVKYRKAAEPGELLRIEVTEAKPASTGEGESLTFRVDEFFGGRCSATVHCR